MDSPSVQYHPEKIEAAAQQRWHSERLFAARRDNSREKFYCLSMFPYPSGKLHMGHVRNYAIGDVISRYQRMRGKNVMQPMGWDAFGLPAENAAIENKQSPAEWTRKNINHMRGQFQRLGFAYDWEREFATCDTDYYRWEQWFFTQLFQRGLVYRKTAVVNWDPVDQTVLANEQVVDGRGWRSGAVVERREIPQWFLRITHYAEELLAGLDKLTGWPDMVRRMQRNWIGRSEGVEFDFAVPNHEPLRVFTTRPDTLMGVSYCAVAAEHPLARKLAKGDRKLAAFLQECQKIGTSEASLQTMEKLGMPLNVDAVHPLSGERVPIWCANFVLMGYGTGAVMAVPGHDQRDWEFAHAYGLPIMPVIRPADQDAADVSAKAFTKHGICYNSGIFDGMNFDQALDALCKKLEERANGIRKTLYRLRDWGISRQRYWGCPIPMLHHAEGTAIPVPEEELPVELPVGIALDGVHSPLLSLPEFTHPAGKKGMRRETDTFDTFFESSWYYARFCCPDYQAGMLDPQEANYWLPVDQYIGGVEHAILHLLYARFFHKLMRDLGLVKGDEPFTRLLTQGMVLKDGVKMSKSRGNSIDPQKLIEKYGADTVRLFTLSAAPPESSLEWSDAGVEGCYRFLKRLWKAANQLPAEQTTLQPASFTVQQRALHRKTHQTIHKASIDIGSRYKFNSVIAAINELMNEMGKLDIEHCTGQNAALLQTGLRTVTLLLAPITPHICEAIWSLLGEQGSVCNATWPEADEEAMRPEELEIAIQVNGKLRATITIPAETTEEQLKKLAQENKHVQRHTEGKAIHRIIVVPKRLINIVAQGEVAKGNAD
ncbi:MAG: leucine--tRNA ligase [Candidatus Eutrophobiaceae bacterium]